MAAQQPVALSSLSLHRAAISRSSLLALICRFLAASWQVGLADKNWKGKADDTFRPLQTTRDYASVARCSCCGGSRQGHGGGGSGCDDGGGGEGSGGVGGDGGWWTMLHLASTLKTVCVHKLWDAGCLLLGSGKCEAGKYGQCRADKGQRGQTRADKADCFSGSLLLLFFFPRQVNQHCYFKAKSVKSCSFVGP